MIIDYGTYYYLNVNKLPALRQQVLKYYKDKIYKWINKYPEFKKFEHLKKLDDTNFTALIYKLLRHYVKRSDLNWYELRTNHKSLKKYFEKKLPTN
jgi:hypothetical protein